MNAKKKTGKREEQCVLVLGDEKPSNIKVNECACVRLQIMGNSRNQKGAFRVRERNSEK